MKLNKGQECVLNLIKEGHNIFCSGVAGTGKSYLIETIRREFGHETLFTSTTGISAVNINGSTLHSTMSIPIGHPTPKQMMKVSKKTQKLFAKGLVKRIVIDEASFITPGAMYALALRLKRFTRNTKNRKIGNIQVIMFSDLGQLGAIVSPRERALAQQYYKTDKFYRMRQFEELDFKFIELTENMRQKDDLEYQKRLNLLRTAKGNHRIDTDWRGNPCYKCELNQDVLDAIEWLNEKCYKYPLPKTSIKLATTNNIVSEYNKEAFERNYNPVGTYTATMTGSFTEKNAPAETVLELKEGLRVIILKNDEEGLYVNGSTGTVMEMTADGVVVQLDKNIKEETLPPQEVMIEPATWDERDYVVEPNENNVEELTLKITGSFEQIPLKQCDALSLHRSQGQTLDEIVLDFGYGAGWIPGGAYVGFSRARNTDSVRLKRKLKSSDVIADYDALEWLEEKLSNSEENRKLQLDIQRG
mgnify:CR=1 FL=1